MYFQSVNKLFFGLDDIGDSSMHNLFRLPSFTIHSDFSYFLLLHSLSIKKKKEFLIIYSRIMNFLTFYTFYKIAWIQIRSECENSDMPLKYQ